MCGDDPAYFARRVGSLMKPATEPNNTKLWQRLRMMLLADTPAMSAAERRHAALGALLGITLSIWALTTFPTLSFWLLAPMGASAVILFGMPKSPVAQPWPVIGGYLVSCLAGFGSAALLSSPALAAGVAVALCLWLMARLNCIHPPGGALALLIVLDQKTFMSSGPHTMELVAANVGLLMCTATLINNLIPGRRYPYQPEPAPVSQHQTRDDEPLRRTDLTHEDLVSAIREMDTFVDIREDDLVKLYNLAIDHAFSRHVGLRCEDVMSRDMITTTAGATLGDAWALLQRHHIKALPVIDDERRLVGIVTLSDFFRQLREITTDDGHASASWQRIPVSVVMTTTVFKATARTAMADLVRDVAHSGRHHIPVVDDVGRLIGIITQSDMLAAMYRRLALESLDQQNQIIQPDLPITARLS